MDSEDEVSLGGKRGAGRWRRAVRRHVPIARWAPRYSRRDAVADAVAGVTLGLTLVPQAIAYASLAGLPVHYGLYSSFVGTIVYVFLGTVREVSIGPTSLMALLTLQATRGLPPQYLVLLTFLAGCAVLLMGVLRLGFLVELISPTVTSGFTTATALIIVAAQLKGLLGLSFTAETLLENLALVVQRARAVRPADCALAAGCCTLLLALRKLKELRVGGPRLRHALFLISIGRNALVVAAASGLAYCLHDPARPPFKLSGLVQPGLPPLALPAWRAELPGPEGPVPQSPLDMVRTLGSSLLLLPVVMVLANIAIAKAFSGGRRLDATQEMLTLGICNVLGALVHAMPTCGAFTRSAVAHSSGVRTPAAGLYSGVITLVALAFLTPYFYFIPKACLSSVLVCAVIFMIDFRIFVVLWRRSKSELAVLVVTVGVGVLWTVELSVLAGLLANLAALLWGIARAPLRVTREQVGSTVCVVVRLPAALVYLNVGPAVDTIARAAQGGGALPVLLDAARLALLDHSATQALERLAEKLSRGSQPLVLYNVCGELAPRLQHCPPLARAAAARGEPAALAAAGLATTAAAGGKGDTDALLLTNGDAQPNGK